MSRNFPILLALFFALPSTSPRLPDRGPPPPGPLGTIAANDNRYPAGRLERNVLTLRLTVHWGLMRPEGERWPGPSHPGLRRSR